MSFKNSYHSIWRDRGTHWKLLIICAISKNNYNISSWKKEKKKEVAFLKIKIKIVVMSIILEKGIDSLDVLCENKH